MTMGAGTGVSLSGAVSLSDAQQSTSVATEIMLLETELANIRYLLREYASSLKLAPHFRYNLIAAGKAVRDEIVRRRKDA